MSDDHTVLGQNPTLIQEVARTIFPGKSLSVERVREGVSTYVYRLSTKSERFYLRVLPEEGASFGPEAEAHRRLRESGVRVPEVIYFEPMNERVQRSIMVTREIPGVPLSQSPLLAPADREQVLAEAGADLARVNQVAVNGFGWIDRSPGLADSLQAPHQSFRAFALEFWETDLAFLGGTVLSPAEVATVNHVVADSEAWLANDAGHLAHGDFDPTHIFQQDGRYTGLIDFGEIRGADQWYDLGHFHLREGEHLPTPLEDDLIRGYRQIVALPPDYPSRIRLASFLINVRALSRSLQKRPLNWFTRHQLAVLREDLAALR
ncbi:MAG TPA: aminoglycoside phosphotransferase family protein [Chloroflexota bacterium]|nr:aminoglycoside phosphotransferase family protein [Chloroflexota bacterium]